MGWTTIVILICITLAVFGVYREYRRGSSSNLNWRIAATLLAVTTLGCFILPIGYSANTTNTGAGKILLTAGFTKDSLKAGTNDSVYTVDKTIKQQYPKAKLLPDLSALFTDSNRLTAMHIFGCGLAKEQLDGLAGKPIILHPSPIPDGVIAANWTGQLKAGDQFILQAQYKNTSAKAYRLVLKGLNTTLDSANMPAGAIADLTLKSTPKNTGRAVYNLLAINGKDTLEQEQLPFIVSSVKPLRVLILSASPDFESKFLKTWLGENSYGVASRSTITKGKFSQEYVNMDQLDLTHLTPGLLNKFDVVVGDLSLLKNLTSAENNTLQQEVNQNNLGIIIRADSTDKKSSWLQSNFPVTYMQGKQAVQENINIRGKGKTAKLSLDPVYINSQNNTQSLVTDTHGHNLASVALSGVGKLIFTTISNSHNWLLAGNKDDYYALWSTLINKAARKTPAAENWEVKPGIPVVNKPVQLVLEDAAENNDLQVNQTAVYPAKNAAIPFQQVSTYWPVTNGWQQAVKNNGTPYWWFAWKNEDWKTLTAAGKLNATRQYVQQHRKSAWATQQINQITRAKVPKIYFFILFLMAVTFLWAESKFYSK